METINISEFRTHLLDYLKKVQKGHEIIITSHGKTLAAVVPPISQNEQAKAKLKQLAKNVVIKDVISPIDEEWDALQ